MEKKSRKKSKVAYCSRTAKFPLEAYMNYVFYSQGEDIVLLYPYEKIYISINDLQEEMQDFAIDWDQDKESGMEIAEVSIVVPITLRKLYKLRKEFWANPSIHFNDLDRFRGFWKAAAKPEFYKLVVTPSWHDKKIKFHAAAPFYITADEKVIDNFMMTSDFPVDERAKYAAIYTFERPLRFNWKTGEISRVQHFEKTPRLH